MPTTNSSITQQETRPCDGHPSFSEVTRCMPVCMNCRKAVEESLTRVAGRRLRRMRALPDCSVEKCAEFLSGVEDMEVRFHLSTMAWWRFSADCDGAKTGPIRKVMEECDVCNPSFGSEYMHRAVRAMSGLTEEQLAVWFGCESLYQIASLFSVEQPDRVGRNCGKCRLLKLGCTASIMGRADDCTLWDDKWLQGVAATVAKRGWRDPCGAAGEGA